MIKFFKSHQKAILLAIAFFLLAVPVVVWFIYYLGHRYGGVYTDISADGMLGYIIGIISAVASVIVSIIAIKQTSQANAMSEKLMKLEESKYNLELRPFVLVSGWSAFGKKLCEIVNCRDKVYICAENTNADTISCLSITLTNTTQSFLTIQHKGAFDHDSKSFWENGGSLVSAKSAPLPAGESQEIIYYASDFFFNKAISHKISFEFILKNRFSESYIESIDIILAYYPDAFVQGFSSDEPWDVSLIPQNYVISKTLSDSLL